MQNNKSGVPAHALCYFQDGDKRCCVFGDFINLQESPAGFGETDEKAFQNLEIEYIKSKYKKVICGVCGAETVLLPDDTYQCMGDGCPMHPDYPMTKQEWNYFNNKIIPAVKAKVQSNE